MLPHTTSHTTCHVATEQQPYWPWPARRMFTLTGARPDRGRLRWNPAVQHSARRPRRGLRFIQLCRPVDALFGGGAGARGVVLCVEDVRAAGGIVGAFGVPRVPTSRRDVLTEVSVHVDDGGTRPPRPTQPGFAEACALWVRQAGVAHQVRRTVASNRTRVADVARVRGDEAPAPGASIAQNRALVPNRGTLPVHEVRAAQGMGLCVTGE